MKKKSENRTPNSSAMKDSLFVNGTFHWKKTEEQVWTEMEEKLSHSTLKQGRKINFSPRVLSLAASVAIIIGVVSFLRLYSVTTYTQSGMHAVAQLPDGSSVHLNAASKLTYYPLWWKINRMINLEGEGFFEVEKGNKFVVRTQYGTVEVLGTSFNVFARNEGARVSCLTGKVKVTSKNKSQVILLPNSKAEVFTDKDIVVTKDVDVSNDISWRNNHFTFESEPLKNVFLEIARQYDVKIKMKFSTKAVYSGNFKKEENVENVLNYVCSAMELTFKKKSDNEYIILQQK